MHSYEGAPDRRLDDSRGIPGEDHVESRRELAIRSRIRKSEPAGALAEIDQQVTGVLGV